MKKIRVGVIGVGHLGSIHANIYSQMKNVSLEGICDINKSRAKRIASLYKTSYCTNYKKLLGKLEAVSIAVPTRLHFSIAKEYLLRKTNVLIEKPITTILKQAEELLKLSKERRVVLQIGHVERFNAAVKKLIKICRTPIFIECHRLGPFTRRGTDVGVVLDLMIHDIDIILALIKSPIKKIDAMGVNILSKYEDIANARIMFKDLSVCNLTASRVTNDIMRKIRIFEKNAYISLDYVKQEAVIYKKKNKNILKETIPIKKEEPLKAELKSFIQCIEKETKPIVSGIEAKKALEIAVRIEKKIRKNKITERSL